MFGLTTNSLQKRIEELEQALETKSAVAAQLEEEVADYKQTIASFHLSTSDYDKKMETLKAKYEKDIKALNAKLTDTEKSVNRRVNQALANIGVSEFLSDMPLPVASSDKELYNKFISMAESQEKKDFYKKHEAAIRRAIGL